MEEHVMDEPLLDLVLEEERPYEAARQVEPPQAMEEPLYVLSEEPPQDAIDFSINEGAAGIKRSRDEFEGEIDQQVPLEEDIMLELAAEEPIKDNVEEELSIAFEPEDANHQHHIKDDIDALLGEGEEPPAIDLRAPVETGPALSPLTHLLDEAPPAKRPKTEEAPSSPAPDELMTAVDVSETLPEQPQVENQELEENMAQSSEGEQTLQPTSVLELPPEIMLKIFVYMSFVDLVNCSLVCHQWKSISSDDVLWKRYLKWDYIARAMLTPSSQLPRQYYQLWGTNAKTWKQLFASHYPEHEEMDMQNLIREMTKSGGRLTRRQIMGLYRLDRSYAGVELLAYPALYQDVWSLSSQEIKMIIANEVGLTARGSETNAFDLGVRMQQFMPQVWKEIKSYDRAQNIIWEMLRYEGEGDKRTWMEEEDASNYTEWLFGYFPYRKMSPELLQRLKIKEGKQRDEPETAEAEEEGEPESEPEYVLGGGQIVGVGRVIRESYTIQFEDDAEEEDYDANAPAVPSTRKEPARHQDKHGDAPKQQDANGAEEQAPSTNTDSSEGGASGTTHAEAVRGRSQVARFFHTGPLKNTASATFTYGFAALSSSRFCTYWIEADEDIYL